MNTNTEYKVLANKKYSYKKVARYSICACTCTLQLNTVNKLTNDLWGIKWINICYCYCYCYWYCYLYCYWYCYYFCNTAATASVLLLLLLLYYYYYFFCTTTTNTTTSSVLLLLLLLLRNMYKLLNDIMRPKMNKSQIYRVSK